MSESDRQVTRRKLLKEIGMMVAVLMAAPGCQQSRARRPASARTIGAPGYDPYQHKWLIAIEVDRCIGCGLCVAACKKENQVPEGHFYRTWVERYTIKKAPNGSPQEYGQTVVESPDGGMKGFPVKIEGPDEVLKAFFVPKLCNLCEKSPCSQVCPVGATFDAPDGVVLVDANYCIGCGFCVQACPYGCRFLNPITKTAEKCTLCYHRITRGLQPACVEVCPTHARIFGDAKDPSDESPIPKFLEAHKVQVLKPHLGTGPRVLYAGLDGVVR